MTPHLRRTIRLLLACATLALSLPALAYLLPPAAVLRHLGQRREALELRALEVTGTLFADGPAADRFNAALGRATGGSITLSARILLKLPGRCRLEVTGPTPAESPYLSQRDNRLTGQGGLDTDPSASAMLRALCTLLCTSTAGDASQAFQASLLKRGVALDDESLGRFDGRIAYVIGGRAQESKPLCWVDKDAFQPLRLEAVEGGTLHDIRLLGWGSPTGGDWFPRAVEAYQGDQLHLRFTTEHVTPNPKFPEALP